MSTIAIIPAKGTSSRIPRKNVRLFHGEPILSYSIKTARESALFDQIIVSTDDDEIAEIAHRYGADVMRRGVQWCGDEIGPLDVARHTLTLLAPTVETVCVIYATAPLLSVQDLKRGLVELNGFMGIAYALSIGAHPFLHDAAQFIWCQAWAMRAHWPEFAERTILVPIAPERDCDINTEANWVKAEWMYATLNGLKPKCCGANGLCADCPVLHEHRYELVTNAVAELVHFRCDCGAMLPM